MNVILRDAAYADLSQIYELIIRDRPSAALGVIQRILDGIERLSVFPRMGRLGLAEGTREWVVRGLPFIIVYRLDESRSELVVIGVFHGKQNRTAD